MRNSFSLSVYFLQGCKCDVKIVYKTSDTASGNMKLIPLIFFISLAVDVRSNEHFTFPPKFHPPNSGIMLTSDSSIYLPPESHTTIPYYPMKNVNNLPYPYLPHTGTKAPVMIPTSYPLILSSTLLPIHHDDTDDEDEKLPPPFQRINHTERGRPENIERRNFKPKSMNYQPIDRIDMKAPFGFYNNNAPTQQNPSLQKATPRSMIISADQQRNDALDHLRSAAAFQGPQYLPAPNAPGVFISSTTETAVPILRLSNEMDLDGSFSYEALGADQTHYVQHSRMENTGTDKEEQVVEGSYSYVGDNGQTYTVHYVADSKGFRASGDHLPVAPPIPEIIQRAVQFNLAEEAKKPPNLKSWNEEKENELSESERYHRFAIPPPPRPLFTGKTPESFSFGFAQGAHNTQNNLVPAASTQNPIRTNNDFTQDQMKSNIANNGGTISPQITFLASQGAHIPSANTQQSISRVFTTDRTTLPQLINYEAAVKEDQSESNKGLWRWQYGLNANVNQTPDKNAISRSSAVGDDVMINFSDMTPDQYTKMIRSQLEPNMETAQNDQIAQPSNVMNVYKEPNHNSKVQNSIHSDSKQTVVSNENSFISTQIPDWNKNENFNLNQNSDFYQPIDNSRSRQNTADSYNSRSKLITQNNFVPQSQLITQSYDYEDSSYEPKRLSRSSTTLAPENSHYFNYNSLNSYEGGTQNSLRSSSNQIENIQRVSTTDVPIISTTTHNIKFNEFIVNQNKNDFRPIVPSQFEEKQEEPTTTTETTIENIIESNMFLKNLFKSNKNTQHDSNKIREDNKSFQSQIHLERKPDKTPKFIQMHAKPHNDINGMAKKPVDIADIMNYISTKNHFESIKVKPKSKYGSNNYNQRSEIRFIPVQHEHENIEHNDDEDENMEHNPSNHRTSYYHPEEMRGIIKNYKVLQRNNSAFKNGQDFEQLRRDLSPPPVKMLQSNLPPLGRAGPSMKSYLPPIYV